MHYLQVSTQLFRILSNTHNCVHWLPTERSCKLYLGHFLDWFIIVKLYISGRSTLYWCSNYQSNSIYPSLLLGHGHYYHNIETRFRMVFYLIYELDVYTSKNSSSAHVTQSQAQKDIKRKFLTSNVYLDFISFLFLTEIFFEPFYACMILIPFGKSAWTKADFVSAQFLYNSIILCTDLC